MKTAIPIILFLSALQSTNAGGGDGCRNGKKGSISSCDPSRRRQLAFDAVDHQALWETQKEDCRAETYSLAVNVREGHLSLLAFPYQQEDCLPLYFHDVANDDEEGKEVLVAEPDTVAEDLFEEGWEDSFLIGQEYTLKELAQAFEAAESVPRKGYSLIGHNCATFVLSMARLLGYQVGPEVVDFVVGQLVHSGIPSKVRSSKNLTKLTKNMESENDDLGLMKILVERYIRTH